MNLRPVSQVMGEAWEAAIRKREMSMNLRATVHTYVENLNDSDLAQAQRDLQRGRCSFCEQASCTNPVHRVLDDLALELLEEEAGNRKAWAPEPALDTPLPEV